MTNQNTLNSSVSEPAHPVMLDTLRRVNRLMVRERDAHRLISAACHILSGQEQCLGARIILVSPDGRLLDHAAAGRFENGSAATNGDQRSASPPCMAPFLGPDGVRTLIEVPPQACAGCVWGFRGAGNTVLTVPLADDGPLGVLALLYPAGWRVTSAQRGMLLDIGQDLGFALHVIALDGERRSAQAALQDSERRLHELIRANADGMIVVDDNGRVHFANRAAERLFETTEEHLKQREFGFPLGTEEAVEIEILTAGGRFKTAEMRVASLQWEGRPSYVAALRDISERKAVAQALQRSERKFRTLFESSRDAIVMTAADGRLTDCNSALGRLLGGLPIGPRGCTLADLFADRQAYGAFQDRIDTDGFVHDHPVQLRRRDGTLRECLITAHQRTSKGHAPRGCQAIIRDVTPLKRALDELRQQYGFLQTLIDTIPSPIFYKDAEGGYLGCNRAFEAFLGRVRSRIIGRTAVDLVPGKLGGIYHARDVELLAEGADGRQTYESEVKAADGSRHQVLFTKAVFTGLAGEPAGIVGLITDITERIAKEEQIRRLASELEDKVVRRTAELNRSLAETARARDSVDGILKSVADGLIVTDSHHRVVLMNRAAEELMGIRLSDVLDRSIDDAVTDATLSERIRATLDKRTSGHHFDFELPGGDPDKPRIMRARTSIITDRAGEQSGTVTIIHDVSWERELNRLKDEFISTAAHQLRAPLTSIRGYAELLRTRADLSFDERQRFMGIVEREADHLAHIINDLLDLSRMEAGHANGLTRTPHRLVDLIGRAIDRVKARSRIHRFELRAESTERIVPVDPEKIDQLLDNLLDNAVKYSPEGGPVIVRTEMQRDCCWVHVSDHGIGIAPEHQGKVFDKFYRADASNTAISGTGLGMVIVKNAVEAHGGGIRLSSTPGGGTTVSFSLPLGDFTDDPSNRHTTEIEGTQ